MFLAVLTLIGFAMSAYAVIAEHYPLPKLRLWVALLLLTWALLGYDIYDHRANLTLRVAPVLAFIIGILGMVLVYVFVYRAKPKEPPIAEQTSGPKLIIHRAVYAAGLPTEVLVTDNLQNIVRDGIAITVDGTLGSLIPDPAFGIPKRLVVDYSYGTDTVFRVSRTERPAGEIMRLVLPEDTEVPRLANEVRRLAQTSAIKISIVSEHVEYNGANDCPLKLRFHLRNDSAEPLDIQYRDYRPELITLKKAVTEIFQIRMGGAWLPIPDGLGHIAVFPTQQFAGWIAADEGRFNKGIVEEHRGKIGTLVLLVNGQNVEIKL